jgi:hypothetical protein
MVKILSQAVHFALEPHAGEIAAAIRSFLDNTVAWGSSP